MQVIDAGVAKARRVCRSPSYQSKSRATLHRHHHGAVLVTAASVVDSSGPASSFRVGVPDFTACSTPVCCVVSPNGRVETIAERSKKVHFDGPPSHADSGARRRCGRPGTECPIVLDSALERTVTRVFPGRPLDLAEREGFEPTTACFGCLGVTVGALSGWIVSWYNGW